MSVILWVTPHPGILNFILGLLLDIFMIVVIWSERRFIQGGNTVHRQTVGRRESRKGHLLYFLISKKFSLFSYYSFFFSHLFLLVGGYLLYSTVVVFVIHWHESAMDLYVFPIPIPPATSLSTQSLWVFPVHQTRALVSCMQPGLVICFTLDNIHV